MCDQTKTTSCATILRETSGRATTTVIAATACQDTLSQLHYEFRFFDDVCLLQIDGIRDEAIKLSVCLGLKAEHLEESHCFLLLDSKGTSDNFDVQGVKRLCVYHCPALFPHEYFLQIAIDEIKEITRKSRKRPSPCKNAVGNG